MDAASTEPRSPWRHLLDCGDLESAVREVACWLQGRAVELIVTSSEPPGERLAAWSGDAVATDQPFRRQAAIPGAPDWLLCLTSADAGAGERALHTATLALSGWRAARQMQADVELRQAACGRELDLLQELARSVAISASLPDLFASAIRVLERGCELDAVLVLHHAEPMPLLVTYLARPVGAAYLAALAERARQFLGLLRLPDMRCTELASYDAARGSREDLGASVPVLLPILRHGSPAACLIVVPTRAAGPSDARLLDGAANQLSLHLERIVAVREVEADRFRSIVGSMAHGVVLADRELRLLHANPAAVRLLDGGGLGPREDLEALLDRLELLPTVEAVRDGRSTHAEHEARLADGRSWSITISPLLGARSRPDGLVLVIRDSTESKRIQQQLVQSERMSSLGQLVSGVAHELNNPLSSILGYTQLLRMGRQDDRLVARFDLLAREAERCRRIVESLLSFARVREPERKLFSLNQSVSNVLTLLAYQLRVDDVRVASELDPGLPALLGDAHQLEQVIVNLLSNARQAIRGQPGGGEIAVSTARSGNGAIVLEVRDNGPGIAEAIRARIFDPFFTTKQPGEGTGLGLSLVYGIVSAHGGTIEALPAPDGGALFRVRLPAGAAAAGHPVPAVPAGGRAARASRILVVDDEEALGRLICEALEAEGHRTELATDGRGALDRVAASTFDLVISDLRMPGFDGERLHDELSRRDPALGRRLLLTTGDTLGPAASEVAARVGSELLYKPFDLDELVRVVQARLTSE